MSYKFVVLVDISVDALVFTHSALVCVAAAVRLTERATRALPPADSSCPSSQTTSHVQQQTAAAVRFMFRVLDEISTVVCVHSVQSVPYYSHI